MADLETPLQYIKGIGETKAKALGKLHIATLGDLIGYFPRSYEDRRTARAIGELQPGEYACVTAMVAAEPSFRCLRQDLDMTKVRVVDGTGSLDITFFNQSYRKSSLIRGKTYVFYGKPEGEGLRRTMINPLVEPEDKRQLTGRIMPVYPLTTGITQTAICRAMAQGLDVCRNILPDPLPKNIRQDYQLCSSGYAYEQIHFPDSEETLALARKRLAFDDLFFLTLGLRTLRARREDRRGELWENLDLTDFYAVLPFQLTGAQRRTIEQIRGELAAGQVINRLIQGDVGSGKTMVAAAAMVLAARNNRQSALMAPTEVLAEQHYRSLAPLLETLGYQTVLLTGGMPAKERRKSLEALAQGAAHAVIGTHALFSAGVSYAQLGLVITDEQHRFGVSQRSALAEKGERPHLLVMSATPIPRTLALMIYGDLDVSILDELPPGRQKIDTCAVTSAYRQRLYGFLRKEIQAGRQAYIICSMVETGELPADERKAVTEYTKTLQEKVFPDLRVACLHGRMKPKEKDAVMGAFSRGETDILVSTTVVEVGVDVPNATVMVIENADRFGLSQLHQLRGRVGRGTHKSYCVLISDSQNPDTRARLRIMTKTGDGFQIAEEDLRLRGPGDFFGQRQHGLPPLKAANLTCDMALLQEAQQAAEDLLAQDPELDGYLEIKERVAQLFAAGEGTLN